LKTERSRQNSLSLYKREDFGLPPAAFGPPVNARARGVARATLGSKPKQLRGIQPNVSKGNMKICFIIGFLILMAALPVAGSSTTGTNEITSTKKLNGSSAGRESTETVGEIIRYLLDYVVRSDCTFIRNGEPHTGKEAAEHFKSKYEHFKKEIKTPEDFIQMAATKSMITGKPYLVKTTDGTEISCAEWLGKILADYRKGKI
jgi:Family of unknown function (DUF5329)